MGTTIFIQCKTKKGTFDLTRLYLALVGLFIVFIASSPSPSWAKPSKSDIEDITWRIVGSKNVERTQFADRVLVKHVFRLGEVKYKVFESSGGQGRVSIEFDLVATQDLYLESHRVKIRQKNTRETLRMTELWKELVASGYSMDEVLSIFGRSYISSYIEYDLGLKAGGKTAKYLIEVSYSETVNGYRFEIGGFRFRIPEYFPDYSLPAMAAKNFSGQRISYDIIPGSPEFSEFLRFIDRSRDRLKAIDEAPEKFRREQMAFVESFFANEVFEYSIKSVRKRRASIQKTPDELKLEQTGLVKCEPSALIWDKFEGGQPYAGYKFRQTGYIYCTPYEGQSNFHGAVDTGKGTRRLAYVITISYDDTRRRDRPWITEIEPFQFRPEDRSRECRRNGNNGWCPVAPRLARVDNRFKSSADRSDGPSYFFVIDQTLSSVSSLQLNALKQKKEPVSRPVDSENSTSASNETTKSVAKPETKAPASHPILVCMIDWDKSAFSGKASLDVQIDFDGKGKLTGWPTVRTSKGEQSTARKLYTGVIDTLESCGPISGLANRKQVVLRFGTSGFLVEVSSGSENDTSKQSESNQSNSTSQSKTIAAETNAGKKEKTANVTPEQEATQMTDRIIKLAGLSEKNRTLIAQTELDRMGCQPGPIDGAIGRKTRQAFARFKSLTSQDVSESDVIAPANLLLLQSEQNSVCNAAWVAQNAPFKLAGRWNGRNTCKLNGRNTVVNVYSKLRFVAPNQLSGAVTSVWKNHWGRELKSNGTTVLTIDGSKFTAVSTAANGAIERYTGSFSSNSMAFNARSNVCTGTIWFASK